MPILVNGAKAETPADPHAPLLDLLRERLEMHGTKPGCNMRAWRVGGHLRVGKRRDELAGKFGIDPVELRPRDRPITPDKLL